MAHFERIGGSLYSGLVAHYGADYSIARCTFLNRRHYPGRLYRSNFFGGMALHAPAISPEGVKRGIYGALVFIGTYRLLLTMFSNAFVGSHVT